MLCVGYNDDDPDNRYWLMLNSWGTASGNRPNGLFRLDMDMNYSCTHYDPYPYTFNSFYWETLGITYGDTTPSQKLIGADDSTPTGITSSNYFILDRFIASQTGTISEIRIKLRC